MNKFFISSLRQTLLPKNNLYAIKFCNFARSTQRPSINKMIDENSNKFQNPQSKTIDIKEFQNSMREQIEKENLNIQNLDQLFGKDENFSQKEKHKANAKKSEIKEDTEETNTTESKE